MTTLRPLLGIALVWALLPAGLQAQTLQKGEFALQFPKELIGFRQAGKVVTPSHFPTLAELEQRMSEERVRAVLFFKLYEDEHNHYAPIFSPDGQRMSVLRADVNRRTSKIRRLPLGRAPAKTLLDQYPDSYDYMHQWAPPYPWLGTEPLAAFASQAERSGQMNLYLTHGRFTQRITSGKAITKHPTFHPLQPQLLFEAQGRINFLTFPKKLSAETRPQTSKVVATGAQPAWGPSGKHFAYCREIGRVADRPQFEISVRSYPFGRERRMYRGPVSEIVRNPTWSPDGKYVAFYRRGKEEFGWELLVSEVATSKVTTLAKQVVVENHFDDVDPCWAPTGHRLYYFSAADSGEGYYRIHWADVDGKKGVVDYSDEFTTATDLSTSRAPAHLPQISFVAIERLSQGVYIVVLNHW